MAEQVAINVSLLCGDCLVLLATLPENSVDACVCDPPYHLTTGKKGGTGPASLNLNSPAGRSVISTGFMGKSWDGGDIAFRAETWREVYRVLKPGAHLVAFGGTRTYHRMACAIEDAGFEVRDMISWLYGTGFPKNHLVSLKPACEPIVLARKPLSESMVAANVLKWGTGALNIGACRVGDFDRGAAVDELSRPYTNGRAGEASADRRYAEKGSTNFSALPGPRGGSPSGRWPANVIHDGSDEVVAAFPETSSGSRRAGAYKVLGGGDVYSWAAVGPMPAIKGSKGSAARFFYASKADADDRLGSKHPTIKPLDLMQYLVRLVTPPKGLVLDPFAGTGTTGEAAFREGMRAVLIECEEEYQNDIRRRMRLAIAGPAERSRAAIKSKIRGKPLDPGPLFRGVDG